jgi:putative phosphoesterase
LTRIGLLSDTHNHLDDAIIDYLKPCDEIWHGGDFGTIQVADKLKTLGPLKGVFGNVDGNDIRTIYPEKLCWKCEEVIVYMKHIGGYPPKYNPETKKDLLLYRPKLFISGHSHILKIIYDDKLQCLHINPGAAGKYGWHKIRTLVRFSIDGADIKDCEVIELPR